LLVDRDGRDGIHHLADDLPSRSTTLLPIVEAASLLGYIHVKEGDAEITPEGKRLRPSRQSCAARNSSAWPPSAFR